MKTTLTQKMYNELPDKDFEYVEWKKIENPKVIYEKNINGQKIPLRGCLPSKTRYKIKEGKVKPSGDPYDEIVWKKIRKTCKYPVEIVSQEEYDKIQEGLAEIENRRRLKKESSEKKGDKDGSSNRKET